MHDKINLKNKEQDGINKKKNMGEGHAQTHLHPQTMTMTNPIELINFALIVCA